MHRSLKRDILIASLCVSFLCCGVQTCGTSSNDPWTVQLPSSITPIHNTFTATIAGLSYDNEYSIAIVGNAGHVTQNNRTTNVIVKDQIDGPEVLYSLIGTDADSILMGWAYCAGDQLTSLFLETTDETAGFTSSTVTGSCNITSEATTVSLVSNAECMSVAQPSAVPTIDGGSQLSLRNGSVGNVTLGQEEFNLIPFSIVDCSECSSNGEESGWIEVHSVMTSKTSADVCLGIFYLFLSCSPVAVQYVQCFMGNATGQSFNAGYDLSSLIKHSVYAACRASSGTGSSSTVSSGTSSSPSSTSSKHSSARPELKVPFLSLLIAMTIGLTIT